MNESRVMRAIFAVLIIAMGCAQAPPQLASECVGSPIIVDLEGDGIHLTGPDAGVPFRLNPEQLRIWSWTDPGADDAFLVFDRDQSGTIDDGSELFGDSSPQPDSPAPNGFAALAVYDRNHDTWIDARDPIWSLLRLWRDLNHDGVSQPDELSTLESYQIHAISVAPIRVDTIDSNGNAYRYTARVIADPPVGEVAIDVWLRSTGRLPVKETLQYKCWGWGYYRNFNESDICDRVYVQGDPIATDGFGRLSRFVARYAVRTTQSAAVSAATAIVQSAVNVTIACSDPSTCSDYCSPPAFPVPDSFRPPPYWSPYDPDVWVRAQCDPPYDDGSTIGGGGGGACR